jgi:hypothetical protein
MVQTISRQGDVLRILSFALVLILLAGCAKGLRRVPAEGTIELDGKPMDGGIVYLSPDESMGNTARVSPTSPIKKGRFQIKTAGIERHDSGPGVPLGWYKVHVRVNLIGEQPFFPGQPAVAIDPIYLDPENTPLTFEVVDNPAPGAYDLKLTSTR